MRTAILSALVLILFVPLGCEKENAPTGVLAEVDGVVITVEDFNREFREMRLENQFSPGGHDSLIRMKEEFLEQLIEEALILKAARRLGADVTERELEEEIMAIKNDYRGESLRDHLNRQGISFENWKKRVKKTMVIEKTIRIGSHSEDSISMEEARAYYEAHREEYILPQRVRARQIVVASERDANKILRELEKGIPFEQLAAEKSLGPEGRVDGDLGYFGRGDMPKEFDLVFSMEEGEISTAIESPYGYHIFKVEDSTPGRPLAFEEVFDDIKKTIAQTKSDQRYKKWLAELKENAKTKTYQHLLEYTE
jgi:parvulin-like peptidyl-prolyl isomerase